MKVWQLTYWSEYSYPHTKLFREENPPSTETIMKVLAEWEETFRMEEKIECLKSRREWSWCGEHLELSLIDVE